MSVTTSREGNTGYLLLDNPPVNAIGLAMRKALLDAVRWAESERLDRVIVTGAGKIFIGGADASEFDNAPIAPHLPDVLNAINESYVPWIAAINGAALGGGAELAMACRMRIMAEKAHIGFPEVNLGVIPGAGGTQRLPRLVGLSNALKMITSGKPLNATEALAAGLINAIDDEPVQAAYMVNTEALGCIVPSWELPVVDPDRHAIQSARELVASKKAGFVAPASAIDVIEAGLSVSFHEGLLIERNAFLELRASPQCAAMRHLFFSERAAMKVPEGLSARSVALDHVAVVGGGTMGAAIAFTLAYAGGLHATILEMDQESVERARGNVEAIIAASESRAVIDDNAAANVRERISVVSDYQHIASASLVIEAAFESMAVKRDVFARLSDIMPADAILASNTSYLDINEIATCVTDPSRVVGLHFFAPAHIMKLLEIVGGEHTCDTALATGYALAKCLRKVPVLVGVCDGFVGNRILARYREAADTVLMDGSTPWDIDNAMVEFGYAMGPYAAQDLSGLDIAHAHRRRQDETRNPERRYIPIADRMIELGKLGRKSGAGWYRYTQGGRLEDPIIADLAIEEAHLAGVERTEYKPEDIRERLLLAMINEAASVLHEGIVQNASDIDLVTVLGYGFPRWRGGLMHYADQIGATVIVEKLEQLSKEDPIAWSISPLLLQCAQSGTSIADVRRGRS